jgi:glycosyltransferase involved in cell wall biosynthesis
MKILWSSNAPWSNSGYGVQAQYLLPRLQAMGHEVAVFAWDGLHHGILRTDGLLCYPGGHEPFGRDFVGRHADHFGADLVVSLQDIWPLPANYRESVGRPWAPWFPVDHEPASKLLVDRAKTAEYPLVYSRHGEAAMHRAGVGHTRCVPFGIDGELFAPADQAEARVQFGLPAEGFLAVMVAANVGHPSRKAFPENMEAFGRFARAHPELDAKLYVHADSDPRPGRGLDLNALALALGIGERVYFPDRYAHLIGYRNREIGALYSAADVLLAATMSEGFGLPVAEAQACGCPVVTTRWAAMPELTFNGVCTEPAQRFWNRLQSWYAVPSVAAIHEALEEIAGRDEETRRREAARGRAAIREAFDWDVVAERYWRPLLEEISGGQDAVV